ncbi:hypothetical protein HOU03_gp145 [Caulobacter phage CcrSC]|uniref:Uncharacterized protein n=1 Tax=Caulobacter phage CcrSC TaxID=2283272 RepID=A0A385EEC0_9CAUD|nr:hypothetical protein HOU03_gp041 [Caulobacter phage CcrSC]YP_009810753.1 hypothetical protein HOU03_gp145 [Caulobacter phage CcrSC]AXQ69623.1 hypothetical protein CcrSC_gp041 [Caulobacter phage CcrSC]AXQ70123.1 hypothetical protein CcrSC_gp541 [Caulobacter phage CcrSC]
MREKVINHGAPHMAKTETVDLALVMLDEQKAALGASRTFTFHEVRAAFIDAKALTTLEATLHKIAEHECNGYRSDITERFDIRRRDKAQAAATAIAERYGLTLDFNGDPRGSALKIKTPHTGRYNGFGGREDGWCV